MTQPTPDHTPVEIGDKRDLLHDRRAMALIGGGLVVVAAVGLFVVKPLLSSSSSSDTGAVASAHHVHRAAAASATPSVTPKVTAAPTPAPKLVVRDPFSPLYVAPSGAAGGASGSASPSTSPTTAPTTQVSTIIVPEPGPTVTKVATAKYTLVFDKVESTTTDTILVSLNGVHYTLDPHATLFPDAVNGPFKLVSLVTSFNGKPTTSGPAEFMYGEESFSMTVGETQYEN